MHVRIHAFRRHCYCCVDFRRLCIAKKVRFASGTGDIQSLEYRADSCSQLVSEFCVYELINLHMIVVDVNGTFHVLLEGRQLTSTSDSILLCPVTPKES
jgi:hypothetical protein